MNAAIIRGPYFRPNSTLLWEYVHNEYDDVDVTGYGSIPAWYDTSELELPIENLHWWDGKLSLFGHENVVWKALEYYQLPNIALTGLREVVEEHDIVHVSENYRIYSLFVALLCARSETTFCVDCHENVPHQPAHPLSWGVKRVVNGCADAFTTSTTAGERALIHEGVEPDDITVLPNVLDFTHFDSGPKRADGVDVPTELESTFNVLFVHGLCEQKGTTYLLDAFESLSTRLEDLRLVLVGASDLDQRQYRSRVEQNPNVVHVEHIPNEEISRLYNLAEVFVLPSVVTQYNEEQFGFAVLEAMACGVPSVVTNIGGLPFVVKEGVTSLVIEDRSAEAIEAAIERLYHDPELRTQLGQGGYEYVRDNYTRSVVGDQLHELYTSVLDR